MNGLTGMEITRETDNQIEQEILKQYQRIEGKALKTWPLASQQVREVVCKVLWQSEEKAPRDIKGHISPLHKFEISGRTILAGISFGGEVFFAEVKELIGEGDFGQVFALLSTFKKEIAIKIPKQGHENALEHEWDVLFNLHGKEKRSGIQSLPKGCFVIEYDGRSTTVMVMERYKSSLLDLLESNPSPFSNVKEVLLAFRVLIKGMIPCSKDWFHRDIHVRNIFVKVKKNSKTKLVIADWGLSLLRKLYNKDLNLDRWKEFAIFFRDRVEKFKKEGIIEGEQIPFPVEETAENIEKAYDCVMHSRDVLGLGMVLYDLLAYMFPLKEDYGIKWKALKTGVPSHTLAYRIKAFVEELVEDVYKKNTIAGMEFSFPKRPTIEEAASQLDNILEDYDKAKEAFAVTDLGN
jgi:serine/threonine protein kinase